MKNISVTAILFLIFGCTAFAGEPTSISVFPTDTTLVVNLRGLPAIQLYDKIQVAEVPGSDQTKIKQIPNLPQGMSFVCSRSEVSNDCEMNIENHLLEFWSRWSANSFVINGEVANRIAEVFGRKTTSTPSFFWEYVDGLDEGYLQIFSEPGEFLIVASPWN